MLLPSQQAAIVDGEQQSTGINKQMLQDKIIDSIRSQFICAPKIRSKYYPVQNLSKIVATHWSR
jgi:hypothetical protein